MYDKLIMFQWKQRLHEIKFISWQRMRKRKPKIIKTNKTKNKLSFLVRQNQFVCTKIKIKSKILTRITEKEHLTCVHVAHFPKHWFFDELKKKKTLSYENSRKEYFSWSFKKWKENVVKITNIKNDWNLPEFHFQFVRNVCFATILISKIPHKLCPPLNCTCWVVPRAESANRAFSLLGMAKSF